MFSYALLGAFLSLGLWSFDNFLLKRVVSGNGVIRPAVLMIGFGVIPTVILFGFSNLGIPSSYVIILSILAGVFFFLGYLLNFKSLKTEQVTNTIALGELQNAIIVAFGIFALAEKANSFVIIGILIVFLGSALVTIDKQLKLNKKLLPAMLANISWAIYWILLSFAILSYHNFAGPLLIARTAGLIGIVISVAVFGFATNHKKKKIKMEVSYGLIGIMVVIGIFDGIGNLSFGYVALSNIIAIGGTITALVPVITGILGRIFYKDKLTSIQLIGFMMCVFGAVIISLL
jgi:drug/metabolite transporter (DMT)-like permease